mgnify:CR=1 FL=1
MFALIHQWRLVKSRYLSNKVLQKRLTSTVPSMSSSFHKIHSKENDKKAEVHIAMYLDFKINFILFISINHNNTYNCSDNFLNNEPR